MNDKYDIIRLKKIITIFKKLDKGFPRGTFVIGYLKPFAYTTFMLAIVSLYGNKVDLSALFLLLAFTSFFIQENIKITFKKATGVELNNGTYEDAKTAIFMGYDISSYVKDEYDIWETRKLEIKERVDLFLKNIDLSSFDSKDYFDVRFALFLNNKDLFALGIKSFSFSFLFALLYTLGLNGVFEASEKLISAMQYFTFTSFFIGCGLITFLFYTHKKYKNFLGTMINHQEALFEIYHFHNDAVIVHTHALGHRCA